MIHALTESPSNLKGIREVLDIIDSYRKMSEEITKFDFIFGVQNTAINLIILIIKKYAIHIRSYKQAFIPNVVVKQIIQRVRVDEKNPKNRTLFY